MRAHTRLHIPSPPPTRLRLHALAGPPPCPGGAPALKMEVARSHVRTCRAAGVRLTLRGALRQLAVGGGGGLRLPLARAVLAGEAKCQPSRFCLTVKVH